MKTITLTTAFIATFTAHLGWGMAKTPETTHSNAACCAMHAAPEESIIPKGERTPNSKVQIVLASEVDWQKLNPARGDKSPQAATLWGDRHGEVPTGFLAKFVDGFSSPPHIHNATYRAVVISGEIHNDDPAAEKMWMPAGSFWTQPKGQTHITAAKGRVNIALVEIDQGPYLVMPPEEAFDSGERPINVDPANLMWLDASESNRIFAEGAALAFLWGSTEEGVSNGTFIKLPAGFDGAIHSAGASFRAVVITGQPSYQADGSKLLDPGSYFSSTGITKHTIRTESESMLYIRTNGRYTVK